MKYEPCDQINVKLRGEQKDWLYAEAERQMSNISVLVRQAIQLLQEKIGKERKEDV